MRENKPKGIKVKFFEKSEYVYYLCPNCYEYLMFDECLECGLICEIEVYEKPDGTIKENANIHGISKFFEKFKTGRIT